MLALLGYLTLAAIVLFGLSVTMVRQGHVAVAVYFGKYHRLLWPGLSFRASSRTTRSPLVPVMVAPSVGTLASGNENVFVTEVFGAVATASVCVAVTAPASATSSKWFVLFSVEATTSASGWLGFRTELAGGLMMATLGARLSRTSRSITASGDFGPSASVACARN